MKGNATLDTPTVDRLLKALLVLSRGVDHILETQAVASAVKRPLSQSKVQIIRLLGQRGPHISTQLARYLGVSKPAVTQIIDSMVRAKQVARRPAKHDRRETAVELTPTGREVFTAIRQKQRSVTRLLARNLGDRNIEQWLNQIDELSSAVLGANEAFDDDYCLQCEAHDDKSCVLADGQADCHFIRHTEKLSKRRKERTSNG